jgi:hypothetical protein
MLYTVADRQSQAMEHSMDQRSQGFFDFVVRNAIYGMIPGMWFAYVGGAAPFWGAAGGLLAVALLAVPTRLVRVRRRPRPPAW